LLCIEVNKKYQVPVPGVSCEPGDVLLEMRREKGKNETLTPQDSQQVPEPNCAAGGH
jgi:hypothetical protein